MEIFTYAGFVALLQVIGIDLVLAGDNAIVIGLAAAGLPKDQRSKAILVGILAAIMGVGGGFIMVPAMIYLLQMPTNVVVGTSLFQIVFVTAATTILHAQQNQTVDIVLALLLMFGGVIGAQFGAVAGERLKGEQLRFLLAGLVLLVSLRIAYGLVAMPSELYSIGRSGGH